MLSTILSKLFKAAFYLMFIGGIIKIVVDSRQQYAPLYEKNGFKKLIIQPGIMVTARRNNALEPKAPDTLIQYSARHKDGNYTIGRIVSLRNGEEDDTHNELSNHIRAMNDEQETVITDSLISLMGERQLRKDKEHMSDPAIISAQGIDSLKGPLMISPLYMYMGTQEQSKYEMIPPSRSHHISQDADLIESLRITPANTSQFIGFLLMDILLFGSLSWIFLMMAKLFGQFSKEQYFTKQNTVLLRNLGIFLLIPQITLAVFYWLFSVNIHPVKWMIYHSLQTVEATYEIQCGVEWVYIFLGAGMIVLSYIFKKGLALKELQAFTI